MKTSLRLINAILGATMLVYSSYSNAAATGTGHYYLMIANGANEAVTINGCGENSVVVSPGGIEQVYRLERSGGGDNSCHFTITRANGNSSSFYDDLDATSGWIKAKQIGGAIGGDNLVITTSKKVSTSIQINDLDSIFSSELQSLGLNSSDAADSIAKVAVGIVNALGGDSSIFVPNIDTTLVQTSVIVNSQIPHQAMSSIDTIGTPIGVSGNNGNLWMITTTNNNFGKLYACNSDNYQISNCKDQSWFNSSGALSNYFNVPIAINMSTNNSGFVLSKNGYTDGNTGKTAYVLTGIYSGNATINQFLNGDKDIPGKNYGSPLLSTNEVPTAVSGGNGSIFITTNGNNSSGSLYWCISSNYRASNCKIIDQYSGGYPVAMSMTQYSNTSEYPQEQGFVLTTTQLDGYSNMGPTQWGNTSSQSLASLGIQGTPTGVSGHDGVVFVTTRNENNHNSGTLYMCDSNNYTASNCRIYDTYTSDNPLGVSFSTNLNGNVVTDSGWVYDYITPKN